MPSRHYSTPTSRRDPVSAKSTLGLALGLLVSSPALGQPVISEFMASNDETLQDEAGEYSDWIEIHNPTASSISLAGWYLTDDAEEKNQWQFPAANLGAGGYLVVFASGKDRTDAGATLHTNFKLGTGGEYLGLIEPDGMTASTEFTPEYPGQTTDISYGVTQSMDATETPQLGYFPSPTPGSRNGGAETQLILDEVVFSRTSGPFFSDTTLTLSGVVGEQVIRYKIVTASAAGGAFGNPTTTDPNYAEPIALINSVVIRAAIFSADGQRFGPMSTHHFMRVDSSSANRVDQFSSRLPLVVFDNHGIGPLEKDGIERPAWLYAFWSEPDRATAIDATPDIANSLELEVRGQTSSGFPKRPYKFDLFDHLGLKVEASLTGRIEFNEWALISPWRYDRAYIRNAFVYGLSNAMGRWAPDTRLVEVFFNADGDDLELSDYVGVYVITDQLEIEPGRIDIDIVSGSDNSGDDVTGGYVVEIDGPDESKYGWTTENDYPSLYTSVLQLDSPKIGAVTQPQIDYITAYVQSLENTLIAGRENQWSNRAYLQYLDRSSWIDFHLLNTFVKNVDAFWRGAKFYKEKNERLIAGPVWDYDRSLGSNDDRDDFPKRWSPEWVKSWDWVIDYWGFEWWGLLAQDPEFMQGWFDRWQELRADPFSTAALVGRIDGLADQIGDAAAARDVAQWPTNLSDHGSFSAEIDHMQDWLSQRAEWIDSMLVSPPSVNSNLDGSTTVTPSSESELVYTLRGADPRLRGGAIAPDALRSTVAVTFPAGSPFRVRGYDQSLEFWPGTKWTRAFPGALGAPYQHSPRLVNLSSRARVEGGENVLISGLVINDADNKSVLLRGVGPTLSDFGVSGALIDPVLTVYNAANEIVAQNTGWDSGDNADQISETAERVGAFALPAGSGDAALLINLPAGNYTVHLGSVSGTSGTGLTEAYEVDDIGSLLNLSVRGSVTGTTSPLIAGFVVTGDQPKRVLVRGVGPSLANFGVNNFLTNPALRIESDGETVIANEDWHEGDTALIAAVNQRVGAFDLDTDSGDAAVVVTLPPGVYTVAVSGADGDAGLALVEVYEVK